MKPIHFSSRIPGALEDNALACARAVRRATGMPVHDLTLANPTQCGLAYPTKDIATALAGGAAGGYEPQPRGLACARESIARDYYMKRHGLQIDPKRIHLASSTSEAYGMLFKLLGNAGAEILAPAPSYPLIEHLAALDGWRSVPFAWMHFQRAMWRPDVHAMEKALTPATRALALIHPHNPTGAFVHSDDVQVLRKWCATHDLALIADEVFLDYAAPGCKRFAKSFACADGDGLVFTLGGLSKCAAMPQLKLAWIHVGGPERLVVEAQSRLDFIADAYLSVATPVQAAAGRLLEIGAGLCGQILERVAQNYQTLQSLRWPDGFEVQPREAGWAALLRRPAAPDEEMLARALLEKSGVLAHPGYYFDFQDAGWHVLSLLPEPGVFREAAESLLEWLPRLV